MQVEWNKVTWYSKLIAVIVFIIVAGLFFWIGNIYGSSTTEINLSVYNPHPSILLHSTTTPTLSEGTLTNQITTITYGVADCASLTTSTTAMNVGDPVVTSSYNLFVATNASTTLDTGISFCYPSYLNVGYVQGWAWPPVGIVWPSGTRMIISSPQGINKTGSPIQNVLAWCLAGADVGCTPPQDFQMIHGISESGLSYYIFWSDVEDSQGVAASSAGPFVYVATPNNPTLFDPAGIGEETFTPSMLRDLTVILNTFTIANPL